MLMGHGAPLPYMAAALLASSTFHLLSSTLNTSLPWGSARNPPGHRVIPMLLSQVYSQTASDTNWGWGSTYAPPWKLGKTQRRVRTGQGTQRPHPTDRESLSHQAAPASHDPIWSSERRTG